MDDILPDDGSEVGRLSNEHEEMAAPPGFLSASPPRASAESVVVRFIATAGVIGIGTAVGAILDSSNVAGWIVALAVSTLSVILAAVLWRSRRL